MSQSVDMWTMRWRTPAPAMDNAAALPTAGAFDHMTTACDDQEIKNSNTPRCGADPARVGQIYFGDTPAKWVRFTSALTDKANAPVGSRKHSATLSEQIWNAGMLVGSK